MHPIALPEIDIQHVHHSSYQQVGWQERAENPKEHPPYMSVKHCAITPVQQTGHYQLPTSIQQLPPISPQSAH